MHILTWLYVSVAVILLFGASIFVHEPGHFLVARRCGLKVEGFSIGLGPKAFGWTRDGIQYAVRWIPAGGFVALPQMVTSETLEGKSRSKEELPPVSPWSKILVALAGPAMNAAFAFFIAVCIYFLGLPVLVNPAIVGGVEPGSPEAALGIREGDRILAVNGKPVSSWEDAQMAAAMAPASVLPVTIERGGVRTNYLLTVKVNEELGLKLLNLEPTESPVIVRLLPGGAALRAGLEAGDEIVSLAGVPVVSQEQLVGLIKKRPGQPSRIEIKRGQRRLALTVTPDLDPETRNGRIGVEIKPSSVAVYELQRPGPLPWQLVGQLCGQTFGTVRAILHSKKTGIGVGELSGPPGILAMLAAELKADYRLALKFVVLLNISLAILNLMPIPVLDGGHIAMAILEQVRGRPLSPRVQECATLAFTTLLISFVLYVSYNDVVRRFPLFKSMLHQQVQIEPGPPKPAAPARP
jgi:regulator of sigma E protease